MLRHIQDIIRSLLLGMLLGTIFSIFYISTTFLVEGSGNVVIDHSGITTTAAVPFNGAKLAAQTFVTPKAFTPKYVSIHEYEGDALAIGTKTLYIVIVDFLTGKPSFLPDNILCFGDRAGGEVTTAWREYTLSNCPELQSAQYYAIVLQGAGSISHFYYTQVSDSTNYYLGQVWVTDDNGVWENPSFPPSDMAFIMSEATPPTPTPTSTPVPGATATPVPWEKQLGAGLNDSGKLAIAIIIMVVVLIGLTLLHVPSLGIVIVQALLFALAVQIKFIPELATFVILVLAAAIAVVLVMIRSKGSGAE